MAVVDNLLVVFVSLLKILTLNCWSDKDNSFLLSFFFFLFPPAALLRAQLKQAHDSTLKILVPDAFFFSLMCQNMAPFSLHQ